MQLSSVASIKQILLRDLGALEHELKSYKQEGQIWKVAGEINNSAGNLTLHICGNLQHFIGATIGRDGYVRQREQEFNKSDLSLGELIREIERTRVAILHGLDKMTDEQLAEIYPIEVFGQPMTFSYFLIHLTGHLMYHLGQINYHRRLLAS